MLRVTFSLSVLFIFFLFFLQLINRSWVYYISSSYSILHARKTFSEIIISPILTHAVCSAKSERGQCATSASQTYLRKNVGILDYLWRTWFYHHLTRTPAYVYIYALTTLYKKRDQFCLSDYYELFLQLYTMHKMIFTIDFAR